MRNRKPITFHKPDLDHNLVSPLVGHVSKTVARLGVGIDCAGKQAAAATKQHEHY